MGFGGHLGDDVAGYPLLIEGTEFEWEWIEIGAEWEILPVKVQRATEEAQNILYRDEMRHLFLGDLDDGGAPPKHPASAVPGKRPGGVEILNHQHVFDLGGGVQQEDRLVLRRHRGPHRDGSLWGCRRDGGAGSGRHGSQWRIGEDD